MHMLTLVHAADVSEEWVEVPHSQLTEGPGGPERAPEVDGVECKSGVHQPPWPSCSTPSSEE